jgi:hypothetical protein
MRSARRRSLPHNAALMMLVVLGLMVLAGTAYGRAEHGTFGPDVNPFSDTVDLTGTCVGPSATGTIKGTETVVGHFSETGPPALNFHAIGTATMDYRIDLVDGRYILGNSIERFTIIANAPQFAESNVTRDRGTLFGASGQQLGQVIIHAVSHITFRDANGNFEPDPGELTANVDHFRVTCR